VGLLTWHPNLLSRTNTQESRQVHEDAQVYRFKFSELIMLV